MPCVPSMAGSSDHPPAPRPGRSSYGLGRSRPPYPRAADPPAYTLSFDGSFGPAGEGGGSRAGAAAVLRGRPGADLVQPILQVFEQRTTCGTALGAEARGCAGGLALIRRVMPAGQCLLVGDSPQIINLGTGAGHVRRCETYLPVVEAIGQALAAGWTLDWARVPRCFNQDADARARRAAGLPAQRGRGLFFF